MTFTISKDKIVIYSLKLFGSQVSYKESLHSIKKITLDRIV